MIRAIASIFGYLMNFIYSIVENYGIAIIIFTILTKLILLPLTLKQQKSLEGAQKIQGKMQELQKKYANDQQKFMEEYQKLLKENNMSMMSSMGCSGCLLNLIQLPILLGMFYMMVSPLTHILKLDSEEILKYKEEINSNRMNATIVQIEANSGDYTPAQYEEQIKYAKEATYVDERYYELDVMNERNLIDMDFLGINLGDVASRNKENKGLMIIPVLSAVFTYLSLAISSYYTQKNQGKTYKQQMEESEIPMPDMRVMNVMMPIMMGYIAYTIPQGVGLYWATSNVLGVIQQVSLRKLYNKEIKDVKTLEDKIVEENEIKNAIEIPLEKVETTTNNVKDNPIKTNNNEKNNNNKKHNSSKKKKK